MDLSKLILPTKLDNRDNHQENGNQDFQTEDLVYLNSYDDVKDISADERFTRQSDYAFINSTEKYTSLLRDIYPWDKKSCWAWLRSSVSSFTVGYIDNKGQYNHNIVYKTDGVLCPALHLNLSHIISIKKTSTNFLTFSEAEVNESKYHTIKFGEYPKSYVGDKENKELENLYISRKLRLTGKTYTGRIDNYGKLISYPEFEYEWQKYVRVLSNKYIDGRKAVDGVYLWVKVEPITWKIRNWNELPKEINPFGSGQAKYMDVITDEAIISGIPFYPDFKDQNCSLWQNSTLRGYLNGINVNNIKTNGNTKFTAPKGGNFTGKNSFLCEAFNAELSKTLRVNNQKEEQYINRKPKLEKSIFNKTLTSSKQKMTNTQTTKNEGGLEL